MRNAMTCREVEILKSAVAYINELPLGEVQIMEVCGTHTHQIARLGLKGLLSPNIRLISGPGCPVCVTVPGYIDTLLTLLERERTVVATFGDLLRVPGTTGSLELQKSKGKCVLTIYSPEEALTFGIKNPESQVVLAAVGFETSAPIHAAIIKAAEARGLQNISLLTALKQMEPAISHVLSNSGVRIDGLLCPGHVAAITGKSPFVPISEKFGIPAVICGFEALDIVAGMAMLCRMIAENSAPRLENAYKRCVTDKGNHTALALINTVFVPSDAVWRGMGMIAGSGLAINSWYRKFDAQYRFGITVAETAQSIPGCICGEVLTGKKTPQMCQSFGRSCTPEHPLGPCMVSSEGACAAQYSLCG